MCRRPRERPNSPTDKPKTPADGSHHGFKASPSPRHSSASWAQWRRLMIESSTRRRSLFQASKKEGKRSRNNFQGRPYNDGPRNSSRRRGTEERNQVIGDLSRSKDYFSGKPSSKRVRAPGRRVALMASKLGQPLCNPHWLLKDTPKKHTLQVNTMWSPCRRSCG